MRRRDPAKALLMLDLLEEFFGGGGRWLRGRYQDSDGNRCLVGAIAYVRDTHHIVSDEALEALAKAAGVPRKALIAFNDKQRTFAPIRKLILAARDVAQAELDAAREIAEPAAPAARANAASPAMRRSRAPVSAGSSLLDAAAVPRTPAPRPGACPTRYEPPRMLQTPAQSAAYSASRQDWPDSMRLAR